jgi:P pilus assembly chaperone PapD
MAGGETNTAGRAESVARRFGLLALVLVPVLLTVPGRVLHSQLAVGRVEVVMQVGARANREAAISVRNESDKPVQAVVRLEDWDRAADGSNRWFPYGTHSGSGSCAPALSIFPQSVRLDPGAEQAIRVVLDSTKAPRGGECWSAAVVETVQPVERGGQRIAYVVRTAVKIYVQSAMLVADGEIERVQVVSDSTKDKAGEQSIEVRFANTGTSHVVARGVVEVRKPDNTTLHRIPLPTVYALPGARHAVSVPMPELPRGDYVFLATMDYGGADIAAALLEHRRK